jgi:effector-binding domain-containing protein
MRTAMGPAMQELLAAVSAQGIIAPGARIFSHHFKMSPDVFDFEVGIAVTSPVTPTGRVIPGQLAARKVARTIYQGGYEGLGSAWGEFEAWLATNHHTTAPDLWESYLTGPDSNPDPATYRTELNRPLA